MLPLVGGLAPAHRRATALSVVVSGVFLGILIARVLSGVVTEYTSWRNVYWLALGLQYSMTRTGALRLGAIIVLRGP